jgi:hypothetical protein
MREFILRISVLTLMTSLAGEAHANYFCEGKVHHVAVGPGGQVTLYADPGFRWDYLCSVTTATNGVSVDACKVIFSALLTAQATDATVQWAFSDSLTCTTHPDWQYLTGWYWGPVVLGQ